MKRLILTFLSEATRRCNNSHLLLWLFGVYGRDRFTVFFWRFYRGLEIKRLSIITLLLAFALTGCAGIHFKAPDLEEVVTGAGPRLVGFFIGKNNPDLADKIVNYCDLLADKDEPIDFKAKLDEGIDWLLNKYIDEPYIVMELENLLPEIEIQTSELPTPAWMNKVKPMIRNFKTGIKFGAASLTSSLPNVWVQPMSSREYNLNDSLTYDGPRNFIKRYYDIYEANYLKFLWARGLK